jgi:hypothetical protein
MGSNTTGKQPGGATGKGFVKGDPRINRNGRPKAFDTLRAEAQRVAEEYVETKDGKKKQRVIKILEDMARNPKLYVDFLQIAYGKVPQSIELPLGGEGDYKLTVEVVQVAKPSEQDKEKE